MKKIIILTIILVWNININGQSNPSKKETIDWLNTYVEQLENGIEFFNNPKGNYKAPDYKIDFYVFEKDNMAFLRWEERNSANPWKVNGKYEKETVINKIRNIILKPIKEYSEIWYVISIYYIGESRMYFYFSDKKSSVRVFKALKKLASYYKTNINFEDKVSLGNKF